MDLKILEIASNTENNKVIDNFTHRSKSKNPIWKAVFNSDVIKLAVPSAVFKAMFPVKPSAIITLTSPLIILFPSI